MKWFTSDWHLGDDRIGINGKLNLFFRPFESVGEQNERIVFNFIESGFEDGDELWHLGDVLYNTEPIQYLDWIRDSFPNSKFNLIIGNYDEDKLGILEKYFDNIYQDAAIYVDESFVYLNHYPRNCIKTMEEMKETYDFCITGHIHGLWKVQKGMVNVGVDAWHFKPVPETTIDFIMNACKKYYDENVFPY